MRKMKNFKMEEFTRSDTARKRGIVNEPGETEKAALLTLVAELLDPLRELYGEPFIINSGYRCPELNKAVGGVPTSQHTKGEAADVRVREPRKLLAMLTESGLTFDQAILYPTFLHLSYRQGNNRKQVLYAKNL